MDQQQQLQQVLVGCLNQATVQEASAQLLELSRSPTFIESLLSSIFQGINDESVLIMALTTYKNFLKEYYNHKTTPLPEDKRKIVRDTCQLLYEKISNSNVAINVYKEIIYILVAVSYPWEGLDITNMDYVEANSIIFEQIGVVYEYLLEEHGRSILEATINQYFPMIEGLIKQILQSYDYKTARVLNCYFNLLYRSMHMEMPGYLRDFGKLQTWIVFLRSVLNYEHSSFAGSPQQNYFLQNQILAANTFKSLIAQHGKAVQEQDLMPWIKQFIAQFVPDILMNVMSLIFTKKHEIHKDVLSHLIYILQNAYSNSMIKPLIMPISQRVFFEEMLPVIDFNNEDLALFENQPLEFIRRQEDLTMSLYRWAAIDVLRVLIYYEFEGKSFLMRFIEYSAGVLKDPNASVSRKATVLYLIGEFKTEVLRNKTLKEQFGNLVCEYFFEYLLSPHAILVYYACRLFSIYLVAVNLEKNIVEQLMTNLFDCLSHKSLAVRFMSVLAFTSLLEDDSEAIQYVQPHFGTILTSYLSLIDQMDHEGLLKALEKMIKFFDKQILSVGPRLIKQLIIMFFKYADMEDKDLDDEQAARFSDNPVTAALSTIRQLLDVDLQKNIYFDVSQQIIDILIFIVKNSNKLKYCYEDIYDIFAVMMNRGDQIADFVFVYLYFRKVLDGVLYESNLPCDPEHLSIISIATQVPGQQQSVLSVLKNLIVKMPRQILFSYPLPTSPDLIFCIIQNKILTAEQLSSLDFSKVTGNWLSIIQSYVAVNYQINNVVTDLNLIKSFPSAISFYPWIATLNDLNILVAIIRKVMMRFQQDDSDENSFQELTPMQMMQKYEHENSDEESDFEDAGFTDEECCYSFQYKSPFPLKNDLLLIKQKLEQLSGEQSQQVANGLGKNEYKKLIKLLENTEEAKMV